MLRANSILFQPIKIGPITIPNRFIRSPIAWGDADENGYPSENERHHMVDLAKGKVGLIIPGFMFPLKTGRVFPGQAGMSSPFHAEKWQKTIEEVHRLGSKVIFQIACGGIACRYGDDKLPITGPSANVFGRKDIRELTKIEIDQIVESFVNAAVNATQIAGVDGIMVHYAHGYLLSQFASPAANKRVDEYGGSVVNRSRIIKRIAESIEAAINKPNQRKYAIIAKCNGHDCLEDGVTPSICAETIAELKKSNVIDLFEISCGFLNPFNMSRGVKQPIRKHLRDTMQTAYDQICTTENAKYPFSQGYTVDYAKQVRKMNPEVKLSLVGGHRSFNKMEQLVQNGDCEMISIARPLIRDPFLIKHFYENKLDVAECQSCNQCFIHGGSKHVACTFPPKLPHDYKGPLICEE